MVVVITPWVSTKQLGMSELLEELERVRRAALDASLEEVAEAIAS